MVGKAIALGESEAGVDQHVKIIGILDIVFGALGALVGFIMLIAFALGSALIGASGERGAAGLAAIVASLGLIGGVLILAISIFEIFVGINLQAYKSWARIVQIIFAALGLFSFPIGTAFGIYALWAMLNKDTIPLFESDGPSSS